MKVFFVDSFVVIPEYKHNTNTFEHQNGYKRKKYLRSRKSMLLDWKEGVRSSDTLLPPQQKQHEVCQLGVDTTTSCLPMYSMCQKYPVFVRLLQNLHFAFLRKLQGFCLQCGLHFAGIFPMGKDVCQAKKRLIEFPIPSKSPSRRLTDVE